ncbi:hypothetical protein E1A91_D13G255900v1 [Gossypium mustelinum]|uniref:Fatty acid desaturase domain-containing protein n=1 Tax=Gossypium mustelinum TaxID=34275 RepID=A0A5D2S6J1_GOSMU|nr:hypothetical protein E1A91_D13G255900v1 [Gossypium mustelinum]
MVVHGKKNKENRGWVNRVSIKKPPFTLSQIKQDILPHCCILTGVWVIAHECGHHAFSDYQWVDNTVGLILHSTLLVPYFSWKISHRRYHSNTGSMEHDKVFVPKPKSKLSCFAKYLNNPPGRVLSLVVTLTLGWPMYLAFNVSGRYYDQLASHYNGPIFSDCERLQVYISDASIFTVIYVLYKITATKGLAWLLCTYGVPLLIVHAFLVLLTLLRVKTQRCFFRYNREYDSLSSVVRTSNLADRHGPGVSFPFDRTLIYKAMWRKAKECLYVEPDVGGGGSKCVFWYRNKF